MSKTFSEDLAQAYAASAQSQGRAVIGGSGATPPRRAPKTYGTLTRHALNGATMGTRWAALFHTEPGFDPAPLQRALQAAVDEVDAQMSLWQPESDLMRLNRAAPGVWVELPARLMTVLGAALSVGRSSGGAFEIGMGDAVSAWGFGPADADPDAIRAALAAPRRPAHEQLELDLHQGRARKHAPLRLDLNGIAKGYGVDRLAEVVQAAGLSAALVSIDGELRALGSLPDGTPWHVAIERPETGHRAAQSMLGLRDAAVATSGDYRKWVEVNGRRLSHTMDPGRGAPLLTPPASVTVVTNSCMLADAWATALMVLGPDAGGKRADSLGLSALFLRPGPEGWISQAHGPAFAAAPEISR
jgi:FAD:protein FMN transferase